MHLNGKLLDYGYRITARKSGLPVSKAADNRARWRSVFLYRSRNGGIWLDFAGKYLDYRSFVMQFVTAGNRVAVFIGAH